MGKSAPPPPDYAAQAAAQGQENRNTAQYNNNANRVDQVTPLGSSTWTIRPGADPQNPQPGDYIQTTSLSSGQQQIFDAQQAGQQQLIAGSTAGVQRAVDAMGQPLDTSGLPTLSGAPGTQQTARAGQGLTTSAPTAGPLQGSLDRSGLPPVGTNDYSANRDAVTQALMARQQPALDLSRDRLTQSLADKGIDAGSTAYTRGFAAQGQTENDARMAAFLAGGQEQSRLLGEARADRGQLFGEEQAAGSFANTVQNQQYNQGLASANFGNNAQAQQFNQTSSADATANALARGDATFNNRSRQQGLEEAAYLRNLPLNEVNSLRSGNQVQSPTFSSYYTNAAGAAPIFDAATATGAQANSANAQNSAATAATVSAIVAALAAFTSDARLKTNIQTIGEHPSGVRRVSWDWIDGSGSGTGVVAQELRRIRPDAVVERGGFLAVHYGMIGGR